MVRQYRELKSQHPGTLLFFRLGDFYELFFEDAVIGARELQITLTARHKESAEPMPMCGVPHHSPANFSSPLRLGHWSGPALRIHRIRRLCHCAPRPMQPQIKPPQTLSLRTYTPARL